MTRALRLVLFVIMIGTLLAWISHHWNGPLDAPWHPWMPWVFWTSLLSLLVGPYSSEILPPKQPFLEKTP